MAVGRAVGTGTAVRVGVGVAAGVGVGVGADVSAGDGVPIGGHELVVHAGVRAGVDDAAIAENEVSGVNEGDSAGVPQQPAIVMTSARMSQGL